MNIQWLHSLTVDSGSAYELLIRGDNLHTEDKVTCRQTLPGHQVWQPHAAHHHSL